MFVQLLGVLPPENCKTATRAVSRLTALHHTVTPQAELLVTFFSLSLSLCPPQPSLMATRNDSHPPHLPGTGGASFELPAGASSPSNMGAPSSVGSWEKEWTLLSRWRSKCKFSGGKAQAQLPVRGHCSSLYFLDLVFEVHRLRKC